jgi:hypothetical protein
MTTNGTTKPRPPATVAIEAATAEAAMIAKNVPGAM